MDQQQPSLQEPGGLEGLFGNHGTETENCLWRGCRHGWTPRSDY